MKKVSTSNSNDDIEELRKLEARSKKERLPIEEHRKILWYRFALRLINEESYWNECV